MVNAAKKFVLGESDFSEADGLLEKIIACATEESVTPAQYMVAMLWHAMRGHDLSKIHFYQDGSGQTYNEDVLTEMHEQTMAEDRAGELETFHSAEEFIASLRREAKVLAS
jgi:hypothetical protein